MNNNEKMQERILLLLLFGLTVLMVLRTFYGTEQTDEAYYIAEAKGVLEGNLPYAFNSSRAVGMVFPMLPFMALYRLLVPDLTGVFLYMRICYVVFRMALIVLILWLLRRQYPKKVLLLAGSVLVVWFGSGIPDFNYTSISSYLLLLTGVLLATALEDETAKAVYRASVLAGVLMAFTEAAHIAMAPNVLLFALLIWLTASREQRWKALGCYILGGLATVFVVLGVIGLLAGFDHLWYGLESFLFYNAKLPNATNSGLTAVASALWEAFQYLWKYMFLAYLGGFFVWLAWRALQKLPIELGRGACFAASLSIIGGCVFLLRFGWIPALLEDIGAMALVAGLGCLWHRPSKLLWFVALPPIFIALFLAVFSNNTNPPAYRFLFMVPALFVVVLHLGQQFQLHPERWLVYASVILSVFVVLKYDFQYVYRDGEFHELTTRVESGIYAGLYTTPQRAEDMPELEAYLKEVTAPGEKILFRDNVPAGYLMQNGVICDIRSWDHLQYSYGCNDPVPLYRYFINSEMIPDKIVYVDYGRDECLSIEDPTYKFNEFVNTFYSFYEECTLNESYRVKIYVCQVEDFENVISWLEVQVK